MLTAGQKSDIASAADLIKDLPEGAMLLADKGYDANAFRTAITDQKAWANIPPKANRKDPICFSPFLYKARNLIERFFNKAKQFRRIATRYDKLAENYLAALKLVAIRIWWALIGFVRIYLVVERKPREARLLQDLVVGIVYVGMLLSILAFVFAVPVGTLITTSGVFAIMLGLALQNTLGDLFSGIALNVGRPYVLGNWIILSDGTEGRVIETNWQSTHLLTAAHDVVAVPNSLLAEIGVNKCQ